MGFKSRTIVTRNPIVFGSILQETNDAFGAFQLLAFFVDENVKKLNQYCSGRLQLFVYLSLYRALEFILEHWWHVS